MIYPENFISRIRLLLTDEDEIFFKSLEEPAPVSVRINPFKPGHHFLNEEQVQWAVNGRYLPQRPSFTFDPLFHAGTYYVQEASSMFLEQAWKTINAGNKPVRVIDLCAAPGGKSTHLLSLMSNDSLLVSNEVIPNRNRVLQENISKWGTANCIVTQNKPEDFKNLPGYFDVVVVDAPCSGEGLFRKDKNAVAEWSESNVQMCSLRQREILKYAIECCATDGYIVYSTCTYEPSENDSSVDYCIENGCQPVMVGSIPQGVISTKYGYQFFPHRIKGEGFYLAVLQKKYGREEPPVSAKARNLKKLPLFSELAKSYLIDSDAFTVIERNEVLFAIPGQLVNDFQLLSSCLYLRQAGIPLGGFKGKDFLPSHQLALSIHSSKNLPFVELSEEDAIAYLRCDNIKTHTSQKGWVLANYKGFNLGWLKIMEGRTNNYYPKEWRILKTYKSF